MATYSRQLLSGSTNGRVIPIGATATPGTLIHTAVGGTVSFDEIYIWVANVSTAAVTLTVEWGGVGDPSDHASKQIAIPANSGPIPIMTGQVLQNALVVRAFSSVANALNAFGYVNRIV